MASITRRILAVALLVALVAVVAMFLTQGRDAAPIAAGRNAVPGSTALVTFHVPTMTCSACPRRVEASVRKSPGIVAVAFAGQDVTVTYDPSQSSPARIRSAIETGGDTVEPVGA